MDPLLTACLLSAPDEPGLEDAVQSAIVAADEVIVGWTGPPGEAEALAGRLGVAVVPIPWAGSFAEARNAMLERARGEWVLMLDADEQLEGAGEAAIRRLTDGRGATGYWIPIESPTQSDGSGTTWITYQVRLFRNLPANRYEGRLGERLPDRVMALAEAQPADSVLRILHRGMIGVEAQRRSLRNLSVLEGALSGVGLDPWTAWALGRHLLRAGRPAEAAALPAALREGGGAAPLLARLQAESLLLLSRAEEAVELLGTATGQFPDYTDLWLLLGRGLDALGRIDEAAQAFRRCLDLGPAPPPYESEAGAGDALALLGLGGLKERVADVDGALRWYEEAYRARPGQTEPLYAIARVYAVQGDGRKLPAALQKLVADVHGSPPTAEQWLVLADALCTHRQYRGALRFAERAAAQNGNPDEVAAMRGYALLGLGQAAGASRALSAVSAGYEWAVQARLLQLTAAWCSGDCQGARALLEQLGGGEVEPGLLRAARAVHQWICRRDEPLEPGEAWGTAGGEFLLQVVDALLAAGLKREAERVAALMERTGWPEGYRALAVLFRLRRQLRPAHRYFDRALAAGRHDFDLLYNLAELELRDRNWPRALRLVTEAIGQRPDDPRVYLLKARVFRAQALELLRQARRRWDDPEAARMLAELTREEGR
ncbi:MAG: tetratricopeptide repeat-containing glycosyltransferase [Bacillota bacterium]